MFVMNFFVNVNIKKALLAQMELNPPVNFMLSPAMDLSAQVKSPSIQLPYLKLGELIPKITYFCTVDP